MLACPNLLQLPRGASPALDHGAWGPRSCLLHGFASCASQHHARVKLSSLSCTVVLHVMCISTADASAGLSRDKSCQLILVAEQGSCCSYARHLRPRFGDCGLRTCPKDNVFFYDFLLENRLWTYVHHEHHAPERSHDSSKAAASFLPVLLWPLAVNSFGSWRLGGHRCTSSTARVRSRPSR